MFASVCLQIVLRPARLSPWSLRPAVGIQRLLSIPTTVIDGGPAAASLDKSIASITLPLPGGVRTVFNVALHSPVRQFLSDIREEDKGLATCRIFSENGDAVSLGTSLSVLARKPFRILLNDRIYTVSALLAGDSDQSQAGLAGPDVSELLSRTTSAIEALDTAHARRAEVCQRLARAEAALLPLEDIRAQLEAKGKRAGDRMAWYGLAYMALQFGFLARLTWWDYSWDIMEPVTYFVGYGTTIVYFAYYVATKKDFSPQSITGRKIDETIVKKAANHGLDIVQYNKLVDEIKQAERELRM